MAVRKIFIAKVSEQTFETITEMVDIAEKWLSYFEYKFNSFSYSYEKEGKRIDKFYKYSANKLMKLTSIDISDLISCEFLFESDREKYMFGIEVVIAIAKCKSSGYMISMAVLKNDSCLLDDIECMYDFFPCGTVKFILADYMNEARSPLFFIVGIGGDKYSNYELNIVHRVARIATGDGLRLPYLFRTSLIDKSYLECVRLSRVPKRIYKEKNSYCTFDFEGMLPEKLDEYRQNAVWNKLHETMVDNGVMDKIM